MKAMIFAAGLGTRLRPLTNDKPKALVLVNGMPLLEIVIKRLKYYGFQSIIINVHHFADKVETFLTANANFGCDIHISDERDLLLETGGGLKKAQSFFDDNNPFLVCNTDILSSIDLGKMYEMHLNSNALATVAVRKRITSRYLIFDNNRALVGWTNVKTSEEKWSRSKTAFTEHWAFSGIHVISPKIFDFMPKEEAFSIIPVYLEAAKTTLIQAYPHDEDLWLDVGKLDALKKAATILPQLRF